jgi:SAM-dependent methyltransferase
MSNETAKPTGAYLLSEVGGLTEAGRLRAQAEALLHEELPALSARLKPGGVFLDIGSGSGLLADAVARLRPDASVYGIDADPMAVAEAQRLFGGLPNLKFLRHSALQDPDGRVPAADLALMRLVLMHLPDPDQALKMVSRWVKPGGLLQVSEGDDRAIETAPPAEWLQDALAMMETVQNQRGGSRQLGRDLPVRMASMGWRVAEQSRTEFRLSRIGAGFPGLFEPVFSFYLNEAEQAGLCPGDRAKSWLDSLRQGLRGGFSDAVIPLFHVVAQL